jgi:hypothetical protein
VCSIASLLGVRLRSGQRLDDGGDIGFGEQSSPSSHPSERLVAEEFLHPPWALVKPLGDFRQREKARRFRHEPTFLLFSRTAGPPPFFGDERITQAVYSSSQGA